MSELWSCQSINNDIGLLNNFGPTNSLFLGVLIEVSRGIANDDCALRK